MNLANSVTRARGKKMQLRNNAKGIGQNIGVEKIAMVEGADRQNFNHADENSEFHADNLGTGILEHTMS